MNETSAYTGMQMQTATEDGDEDPNSKERRMQRERVYRTVVEGWS